MSKWVKVSLRDISQSIQYGYTESAVYEPVGPKFLRITDIVPYFINWDSVPYCNINDDDYKKYKLQVDDIVIARTGATTGYNAIITQDIEAVFASYLIKFRINGEIANSKFIGHLLKSKGYFGYINCAIGGAAQPGINAKVLSAFSFMLPQLPTQNRIVNVLSAYDDLIENNNRRIVLLEKAAQELYKEWFVRFRFPEHESARFENSIPEGWAVSRLGESVIITSSKRIYMSEYVDIGIPFYRSKEVIQSANGEALTEPLYISAEKFNELKDRFGAPCENDILITSVGTIGVSFLVDNRVFYFKDGNLTWIQSSSKPEFAIYIYQWLNSATGKSTLLMSTIGTSQSALTIENLKKIKIILPKKEILKAYYNKSIDIISQKRLLQTKNQNLIRQRDMLLPRLMSGKLEV